jgi:hypothetical protein
MSRQFTPHDSPDESPRIPLVDASRETIRTILAVPVDTEAWQAELDAAEAPVDDPESGG